MRQLLSPADDAASRALVTVQTATTRVKETICDGVSNGWKETEITAKLNAVIAAECRKISDVALREQTRKALVTAARKWHYELTETYRILDRNLAREANRQPLDIDVNDLLKKTPYERTAELRKILDEGTSPGIPLIKDYQRSVKIAVKAMSAEPPKTVTVKGGRSYIMPVRLRAELAARYAAAVDNLQTLINDGVLFCWISSHPNCSPRCKDFQGKLYSLFTGKVVIDGEEYNEAGTIDGIRYESINVALAGSNGDGNGCISGYNCRHRAIEYQRGSKPPQDFSEAEIKREYAIDKQQRSYENRIRQLKTEERQLRACGMIKEAAAVRKQWRSLTVDYQIFSAEHDRAFYPYRCVVDEAEISQNVDNSQESGIIEVGINPWQNDLLPHGHVGRPANVSRADFIQQELGVSKNKAEEFSATIVSYSGTAYSAIRAYQQGYPAVKETKILAFNLEEYIKKAPRWNGGETFRGVRLTQKQIDEYIIGSIHDMLGTSSWSDDLDVAKEFSGETGFDKKSVIFHCSTQSKGTSISHLSNLKGEGEIIVSKESRYRVINIQTDYDRRIHIYLEEIC